MLIIVSIHIRSLSFSLFAVRFENNDNYQSVRAEVIRHESYSNMADVYSFAIVMWQLVTREDPYVNISQIEAAGKVAIEQARPPIPEGTPQAIAQLIRTCWTENPDDRLPFEQISTRLGEIQKNMTSAESKWLDAPLGNPVYYPRAPPIVEPPVSRRASAPSAPTKEDKKKFKLFGLRY